ncbi:unnamed protein product [Pieris macdunnoughi]|uniref:Reverse transcriptase domain-containing protein n=1 Tax=Pieris macdunnoughi TaxID=345717 RepID=A0A821YDD3_9NEOP|nr:unnamed protein product [Pieris macdunnoughi]
MYFSINSIGTATAAHRDISSYPLEGLMSSPGSQTVEFEKTLQLAGKKIFSTLDLNLTTYEPHLVATTTGQRAKRGENRHQHTIWPFRVPAHVSRSKERRTDFPTLIPEALRELDFVFPFVDDLLIASTEEEHRKHLRTRIIRHHYRPVKMFSFYQFSKTKTVEELRRENIKQSVYIPAQRQEADRLER